MSEAVRRADLLRRVERPGRYIGGEWNARRKDPRQAEVRIALVFPDVYEIGMSYLGQKILYGILNDRPGLVAERVFAPWVDLEQALTATGQPLFSLESGTPLAAFDILGFSLLYELNDSNILTVLRTGGVPLRAAERDGRGPLVIAGGPAAFNPEPLADIFDLFFIGDGEEGFPEIAETYRRLKKDGASRAEILRTLAGIPGVYVPSFYEAVPSPDSFLWVPRPRSGAPSRVEKRLLRDLDRAAFPEAIIVPGVRPVFDRVAIEVARGCPQNCRFCQAASLYFPHRPRDPQTVVATLLRSLRVTGYEDASLAALSVGDFPRLSETVGTLMDELEKEKVSLSLSSLRPGALTADVARSIVRVRKTGFTLVPEAGTERLRRVINKDLRDEDLREALTYAFTQGWRLVKLYFMVGLPTEREDDLRGIAALIEEMTRLGQSLLGRPPRFNVSVASFIPKPHTPFQWLGMDDPAVLVEKQRFVRGALRRRRNVEFKEHPVPASIIEGVFSRGDRRLGAVLGRAWELGARFDSWHDRFNGPAWEDAFQREGLFIRDYLQPIPREAPLPWDVIDTGLTKAHLLRELDLALRAERSPACRDRDCRACDGCRFRGWKDNSRRAGPIEVRLAPAPALGERTDAIRRYRAVYRKTDEAKYLSHIDLIHVLQRAFRRARLEVHFTQGFHPKMSISYGPALPLGMDGLAEVLEFKSFQRLEEAEFLAAVNRVLPAGLSFSGLQALEPDAPSLAASIAGFVYRLDLQDMDVKEALERRRGGSAGQEPDDLNVVKDALTAYKSVQPPRVQVTLDERSKTLRLETAPDGGHAPRPQDIVRDILGLENSVWALRREAILLRASD